MMNFWARLLAALGLTPKAPTSPTPPLPPPPVVVPPVVTPPAVPPVVATPPAAPQNPGSYATVFFEDFSGYKTTADLKKALASSAGGTGDANSKYNDALSPALVSLDTVELYAGHPTMKYSQPSGVADSPSITAPMPKPLANAWIRVRLRFSKGFTTDGTTPNYGKGFKLLGWGWDGTDGRGSIELGNISQYYIVWSVAGKLLGHTGDAIGGSVKDEWADEQYYDFIVHFEKTGAKTVNQTWWMAKAGTTPVKRSSQTGTMTTGDAPKLSRLMLSLNFNQSRYQAQDIHWAQAEVVDGLEYPNPFNVPL